MSGFFRLFRTVLCCLFQIRYWSVPVMFRQEFSEYPLNNTETCTVPEHCDPCASVSRVSRMSVLEVTQTHFHIHIHTYTLTSTLARTTAADAPVNYSMYVP